MRLARRQAVQLVLVGAFAVGIGVSFGVGYAPGRQAGRSFGATLADMGKLLPCAFVLIALFDVWVKRETVERHFGKGSGVRGYLWGIVLAGMSVGGMYVAFPVAYALLRKGARLETVLAYLGLAGVCRVPMVMFEASFMGALFTAVRLSVSVPLVILTAIIMGRLLERRGWRLPEEPPAGGPADKPGKTWGHHVG